MFRLADSSSDDDECTTLTTVMTPPTPTSPAPCPPPPPSSSSSSPLSSSVPFPSPRPQVPRATSSILLSNGKPLKSSLKSSSSSPALPVSHSRARSEPSTPLMPPKNVHFPSQEEGGLVSVRLFNRSAKPASLSKSADDTETETENEAATALGTGGASGGVSSIPWPSSASYFKSIASSSPANSATKTYELDVMKMSVIPRKRANEHRHHPASFANVHLESVQSGTGTSVTGTILVRNIAYEKQVAVRFTLDDWQTTSEVLAHHLASLAMIPDEFVRATAPSEQTPASSSSSCTPAGLTIGDLATKSPQWDRFGFTINLEDYALNLDQKTMWLVTRYTVPCWAGDDGAAGGHAEWWDNNAGGNYRLGFKAVNDRIQHVNGTTTIPKLAATPPPPSPIARSSSASAAGSFSHHQKFYSYPRLGDTVFPRPALPSLPLYHKQQQHYHNRPHSPQPAQQQSRHQREIAEEQYAAHQAAVAQTTLGRLKKLNLRNYAAPHSSASAPTSPAQSPGASPLSSRRSSLSQHQQTWPILTISTSADDTKPAHGVSGEGLAAALACASSSSGSGSSSAETTPVSSPKPGFLGLNLSNFSKANSMLDFGVEMGGGMEFQDGAPATPVMAAPGSMIHHHHHHHHHQEGVVEGVEGWAAMSTSPPFSLLSSGFGSKHRRSSSSAETVHAHPLTIAETQSAPTHPPRRVRRPSSPVGHDSRSSLVKSIGSLDSASPSSSETESSGRERERQRARRPPSPPMRPSHHHPNGHHPAIGSLLDVIKEKSTTKPSRGNTRHNGNNNASSASSGSVSGSSSGSDSDNGMIYTRSSSGGSSSPGSGSSSTSRGRTPTPTQSLMSVPTLAASQGQSPPSPPQALQEGEAPDSVYQAFVRQWCFAHGSATPPGVAVR